MRFPKSKMRIVKKSTGMSRNDKPLAFVSIADVNTFENEGFILNQDSPIPYEKIESGKDYEVQIDVSNKFTTLLVG